MAEFAVASIDDVGSEMAAFDVAGSRVGIARADGTFYAFGDTCTHRGCSLTNGELDGAIVTCPCHGSQFDVTTGEVIRGPAQEAVPSYAVRTQDGSLLVEV